MSDNVTVTGMVIKTYDYSEYDKRLVLLTRELGKITVFARGVRRQGSRFMAAGRTLAYGRFRLFEGKSAYNLSEADITNYFEDISLDMEKMVYASFFCDMTEYCTRENVDHSDILKLLYRTMQALLTENIDNTLISSVFQLKLIMLSGEYPGAENEKCRLRGTFDAIDHIAASDIKDLYSFRVKKEVEEELSRVAALHRKAFVTHQLKSLEVIRELGYNI